MANQYDFHNVSLKGETYRQIREIATAEDRSLTSVVKRAIDAYLREQSR